eukprot:gnl/TRDRNA2_/TRDRNA2_167490_c0_seq2.p1 gnl/TRDRNA2_/TRDRNA2_167490_c0~~gnl/TRDRNA2_/TRDRNA2_167490_c0_seq2.p1  ORF type:complete len:888 (-),score=121.55 gnl/TRDRNA2_/TRDRNA2_167490_c0_seq2:36-2657(-)
MRDLLERYLLLDLVGIGSSAKVFLAVDRWKDEYVAVKFVARTCPEENIAVLREATLVRWMNGTSHTLQFLGVYEATEPVSEVNAWAMVTEFLAGGELFELVRAHGPLPEDRAKYVVRQLFSSINSLHQCGILHRDIKTENAILTGEGDEIKLVDFGMAVHFADSLAMTERCGSPGYIAPEVLRGESYGFKMDCFSVGVLMYILLAGHAPFRGNTAEEMLMKNILCRVSLRSLKHTSKAAQNLITKLLTSSPDDRLSAQEALRHEWLAPEQGSELHHSTVFMDAMLEPSVATGEATSTASLMQQWHFGADVNASTTQNWTPCSQGFESANGTYHEKSFRRKSDIRTSNDTWDSDYDGPTNLGKAAENCFWNNAVKQPLELCTSESFEEVDARDSSRTPFDAGSSAAGWPSVKKVEKSTWRPPDWQTFESKERLDATFSSNGKDFTKSGWPAFSANKNPWNRAGAARHQNANSSSENQDTGEHSSRGSNPMMANTQSPGILRSCSPLWADVQKTVVGVQEGASASAALEDVANKHRQDRSSCVSRGTNASRTTDNSPGHGINSTTQDVVPQPPPESLEQGDGRAFITFKDLHRFALRNGMSDDDASEAASAAGIPNPFSAYRNRNTRPSFYEARTSRTSEYFTTFSRQTSEEAAQEASDSELVDSRVKSLVERLTGRSSVSEWSTIRVKGHILAKGSGSRFLRARAPPGTDPVPEEQHSAQGSKSSMGIAAGEPSTANRRDTFEVPEEDQTVLASPTGMEDAQWQSTLAEGRPTFETDADVEHQQAAPDICTDLDPSWFPYHTGAVCIGSNSGDESNSCYPVTEIHLMPGEQGNAVKVQLSAAWHCNPRAVPISAPLLRNHSILLFDASISPVAQ